MNARLAPSLGMVRGVTHAEYISAHADGRYYFLEIAARVGGAFISDLVEVCNGREPVAGVGAAGGGGPAGGEPMRCRRLTQGYAGSVLCLAKTAEPDTTGFDAPEIVVRMKKHHHAGLIVRSDKPERVRELLEQYSEEFAQRFLAPMPPPLKPTA